MLFRSLWINSSSEYSLSGRLAVIFSAGGLTLIVSSYRIRNNRSSVSCYSRFDPKCSDVGAQMFGPSIMLMQPCRPGEGPERGLNLEKAVEPQKSAKGSKNQPYAVPGAINQRVRFMKAGKLHPFACFAPFCGHPIAVFRLNVRRRDFMMSL